MLHVCASCVSTFSSDYSAQLVPVTSPPPTPPRPPPATLIISAHSVANFVLSSISVVAGMLCWLSPGSSRPARRFRYEKDAFCTDALIGGIIKY